MFVGAESWYSEYKRLTFNIPMVLTDEFQYTHSHQVLHVSFSHNGRMFATCSKDGFVHVSSNDFNSDQEFSCVNMKKNLLSTFVITILFSTISDMEFNLPGYNQILS